LDPEERTPLWVKVFATIAVVVMVLVAVVLITGRGGHGPSRHGLTEAEPANAQLGHA
jgi:hypothetical protein